MQQEAAKNMAFHLENMECLQKEANTTLTFLFLVISAAFSGSVKLFSAGNMVPLAISIASLCVYLTLIAVYLVYSCMRARDVDAPANEPKNLKIKDGLSSEEIQAFELENLQARIDFNKRRNAKTAFSLNLARFLICASPVVFLIVIFIARF